MEERLIASLKPMLELPAVELEARMEAAPELYIVLLSQMQALLAAACGQPNKCGEAVTALRLRAELRAGGDTETRVVHIKSEYGADIRLESGEEGPVRHHHLEDKTSLANPRVRFRCNWMVEVDRTPVRGTQTRETIAQYITLCHEKMAGGGLSLTAMYQGKELNRYRLDGNFMALYLTRLVLYHAQRKASVNLGCDRCPTCQHYHRITRHLQVYEALFLERKQAQGVEVVTSYECFSEKEWQSLIGARVPSKCKTKLCYVPVQK